MKEFVPALLMILCGVIGLTFLHSKDIYAGIPLDHSTLRNSTIAIKAISDKENSETDGIRILDIGDITISADSLR